jgi:hypothetical protein
MKSTLLVSWALIIIVSAAPLPQAKATPPPALLEREYLFEVIRHLYRWHLDEKDVENIVGKPEVAFWVRDCTPELDPGDNSRLGDIVIPDLDVKVTVKKASYRIQELDLAVKDKTFKIINVARGGTPAEPTGYKVVTASYQAMLDYAHRTRNLARFPENDLLMRLRLAARKTILKHLDQLAETRPANGTAKKDDLPDQEQVVYFAPLSDVANEIWVFWETGRSLIRFTSDMDLENPALWDHDQLVVRLYDIDEQTVVSLSEVAGSNAYMTRDQVGRALFNCIILGKRAVLQPLQESEIPAPSEE